MLLNILQCIGQPLSRKNSLSLNVSSAKAETPCSRQTSEAQEMWKQCIEEKMSPSGFQSNSDTNSLLNFFKSLNTGPQCSHLGTYHLREDWSYFQILNSLPVLDCYKFVTASRAFSSLLKNSLSVLLINCFRRDHVRHFAYRWPDPQNYFEKFPLCRRTLDARVIHSFFGESIVSHFFLLKFNNINSTLLPRRK